MPRERKDFLSEGREGARARTHECVCARKMGEKEDDTEESRATLGETPNALQRRYQPRPQTPIHGHYEGS